MRRGATQDRVTDTGYEARNEGGLTKSTLVAEWLILPASGMDLRPVCH